MKERVMDDLKNVQDWFKYTRFERLAQVIYPRHAQEGTRRVMNQLAAGERSKPPTPDPLLPDATRGAVSPLGGAKW
jgi:hypothetical protein